MTSRKILIVDDDLFVLHALKDKILASVEVEVLTASTYKECVQYIRDEAENIAVAIVDLKLPDSKDGSVLYLTNTQNIPSIVFTGSLDENIKASFMQKNVVEYIIKNTLQTLEYTAKLAIRIIQNYDIDILIVDDSTMSLNMLELSLEKMHLNIHKASDGIEALKILEQKDKNFSLVITDYNMPNMDGLELTQEIRKRYKKEEVAVIALSAQEDNESTSLFLKVGANDFVKKPFSFDELALRINLNLDMLDLFSLNRVLSTKDSVTPVYNKRFFTDSGQALLLKAQRDKRSILAIVISIDNFQNSVNDYGHTVGERILNECATIFLDTLRQSDLIARLEGERFAILLDNISKDNSTMLIEKIHQEIRLLHIKINHTLTITNTLSVGAVYSNDQDLDHLVEQATSAMTVSQTSGKDKTTFFEI